MNRLLSVVACLVVALAIAPPTSAQVTFQRDVAPLLVKKCLGCHGEQKFKGEFQLHTFEALLKPGESEETPIVAGKPDESYLLTLVTQADAKLRMPKDAPPLAEAEVNLLRQWIAEGAKLEGAAPTTTLVNLAQWKHPPAPEVYSQPFPVTALALRPDGAELAVGGLHEVTIWNSENGTLMRRLPGFAERIYAIAYTKDGNQLAIAAGTPGQVGEVKIVSAADGTLVRHFGSMPDCELSVALSPDESRLAACGADNVVRVYSVASGQEELTLKDHSDWVMSVAWSPDGNRLATASRDKTCKVFDAKTGQLVTTFPEHAECVTSIAYLPDGKNAVSCGADNRLRYWLADDPGWEDAEKMDKKKRHQIGESGGFGAAIQRLVVGGGHVFACAADQTARQFNVENRGQTRSYNGHQDWVIAIDYHDGTKRLTTGSLSGEVRIWKTDAKDEKEMTQAVFFAAPGYVTPQSTDGAGAP